MLQNALRGVTRERPPRPRLFGTGPFVDGASTPPLQGGECARMSTRYNGSPAVDAGSNHASFDWSVNKDGALKEFDQASVMGKGKERSAITAKFNAKQNQTAIETNGSKQSKVVKPGLVLLRLTTNKGVLGVEY